MKLKKRKTIKSAVAANEFPESNFIPYLALWDEHTVVTKDKEMVMVVKLDGYSFETADDEDVDMRKTVRNTLMKSTGNGNFGLWFHVVRRKQSVDLEGEYRSNFCRQVHDEWQKKHAGMQNFRNELYLSIVLKNDSQGSVAKINTLLQQIARKADKEGYAFEMVAWQKDLADMAQRLMGTLREYKPRLLGVRSTEKGHFSEVLEFLGMLVNGAEDSSVLIPSQDISRYLPTHRLYFGKRAIEIRSPTGQSRFAGAVSIKEYSALTNAGMMDAFLQLPFEFILSQSYLFTNRLEAINQMSLHQRRMRSGGDKAISQANELTDAMDLAMSGHIAFGKHHLTIMCYADNLKDLEMYCSLAYGELIANGISPARETINLQASYWAMLPANAKFIARGSVINTMNLASFCSFHNYPVGKKDGNLWGPAVTVFDTTSGTPYFFNFHNRDVGHTTIIGPTGAGKTVLMNFLCAQAQKFNCRMFFFDKDRGADIFIRALGGEYTIIEPGRVCNFNPLQLPDTSENRGFLVDWLKALVTVNGEMFTAEDMERISEAIEGNFLLPKEERMLTNIAPFMGLEGPGTLAGRLKMWHGVEPHAGIFDNREDHLDFSKNTIFGFEMGEVLKDKLSLGPVLLYLFHKVSLSLDGTPTIIVLDEAWALIDNEVFAPKIKDWLKTLRKLNAMVVFATQSVEDASKSNISDTLVQQSATQIFLPNAKATEEYRKVFMITQREFALIKTTPPGTRYFLVKQGDEVVVARIDLSGMSHVVNVLSGRAETVGLLDEIRKEVGDNPDVWLPEFYQRVKEIVSASR